MNTTPSAAVLDPENWSRREAQWRAPAVPDDEPLLFDEPGRVLGNVDYRSHYYRVVGRTVYTLYVRHGAGDERILLPLFKNGVQMLEALDSDSRYLVLHALFNAHRNGRRDGNLYTAKRYQDAFVDGRLRKRKVRGQEAFKVWIEDKL